MKWGSNNIANVKFGDKQVIKVYYGDQLVWPNRKSWGYFGEHKWVDLGLPSGTYWADRNVGATTLYEPGNLYAWGETEVKDEYTMDNSNFYGYDMRDFSGEYRHDAAYKHWGYPIDSRYVSWRMPNKSQIDELVKYCRTEIIDYSDIDPDIFIGGKVCKVTGPNGNYILFPMTRPQSYWSTVQVPEDIDEGFEFAYSLSIYNTIPTNFIGHIATTQSTKEVGLPVRPVLNSLDYPNYFVPYQEPLFSELPYIEFLENKYIDTGIIGVPDLKIIIDFIEPDTVLKPSVIFTNETGEEEEYKWALAYQEEGLVAAANTSKFHNCWEGSKDKTVIVEKNYVTVNGAVKYLNSSNDLENTATIKLGNVPLPNYGTTSGVKIKNFRILDSGIYVCNLIPVRRNLDNKPYLFDTITQRYFDVAKKHEEINSLNQIPYEPTP